MGPLRSRNRKLPNPIALGTTSRAWRSWAIEEFMSLTVEDTSEPPHMPELSKLAGQEADLPRKGWQSSPSAWTRFSYFWRRWRDHSGCKYFPV